ncbi:MAG: hypothetical protein HC850_07410 [Rhodomicrobium sp.]|nr:hypothetical protein [Rhodomicrobium sp.]
MQILPKSISGSSTCRKRDRTGRHLRALGLSSLAVLLASMLSVETPFGIASAEAKDDAPKMGVILSNLPPRNSKTYKYLRDVAGATGGEMLPMSKSEMWMIDPGRIDMVMHVIDEQDIKVQEVSKNFNQIMSAMPDNGDMSAKMMDKMASGMMKPVMVAKLSDPGMVEYALGRGKKPMIGSQRGPGADFDEIKIPISATETVTANRTAVYTTQDGCFWQGKIAGTGLPISLMWWPGGRMSGSFTHDNKQYTIKNIDGEIHAMMEIEREKMPDEHPRMPAEYRSRYRTPDRGMNRAPVEDPKHLEDAAGASEQIPEEIAKLLESQSLMPSPQPKDKKVVIDVLFVYTKKAARHYTDIRRDIIALAAQQTTQSFRNSHIDNVEIKVAGSYMTSYDEGAGNLYNHLWRFADRGDGHMEEIHKLRNRKKADVAVLIVDSPGGCGLATRVAAFEDEAFAVVHHECATTTFSVAHEIGHLIGARHDRSLDKTGQPFPYGHGYANGVKWRTMMAYKSSCNDCPRLPIWSSPAVKIEGEAAGDPNTDNARVIFEQAARVARFR